MKVVFVSCLVVLLSVYLDASRIQGGVQATTDKDALTADDQYMAETRGFFDSLKKCKKHCHGHCPEVKKGKWKCVETFDSLKKCKKHCHGHCPEVKKGQWKCVNSRSTSVREAISYLQQAIISTNQKLPENREHYFHPPPDEDVEDEVEEEHNEGNTEKGDDNAEQQYGLFSWLFQSRRSYYSFKSCLKHCHGHCQKEGDFVWKCLHRRSLLEGEEEDVIEEMEEERDASEDTDKDENHGIESRHFFNSFKKCKKHCHHGHCPEVKKGKWKCVRGRSMSLFRAILSDLLLGEEEDVIEEMEEERDASVDTDKDENHGIESRTILYTSPLQCLAKCDTYCYAWPQGQGWECLR